MGTVAGAGVKAEKELLADYGAEITAIKIFVF